MQTERGKEEGVILVANREGGRRRRKMERTRAKSRTRCRSRIKTTNQTN